MKGALILTGFMISILGFVSWQITDEAFFEDFEGDSLTYFRYGSTGTKAPFKWKTGVDSPSEPGTVILSFKIDPEEEAGAGKGPEIISKDFTHFGRYAVRIKVPDVVETQPDVGAVVGYFTYHMEDIAGLSEIDFEWLLADPKVIYVGTWTGHSGKLKRIGRTINMATGEIYSTIYKENYDGVGQPLSGLQNQPETITPIEDFDASKGFHTYGFDWYPDQIRWWMLHPETSDTITLWDYQGSKRGIPQHESKYRLNFWHTADWSVETNPNSLEKPMHPYEVEVDWMSYEPVAGSR